MEENAFPTLRAVTGALVRACRNVLYLFFLIALVNVRRRAAAAARARAVLPCVFPWIEASSPCTPAPPPQFIFAAIGMLLFFANDPLYFGTLPAALMSVWQVETLDEWEEVMQVGRGKPFLSLSHPKKDIRSPVE